MWVRLLSTGEIATLVKFQFTHPCGCDEVEEAIQIGETSFNSRTRVGATPQFFNRDILSGVSIHAPVWVRQLAERFFLPCMVFQFTHPCGCDGLTNTV